MIKLNNRFESDKIIPIFTRGLIPGSRIEVLKHWRKLNKNDILAYFKTIRPRHHKIMGKPLQRGKYCDRCGSLFGPKQVTIGPHFYKDRYFLCDHCYEIKTGEPNTESVPDLEDLERIGIDISELDRNKSHKTLTWKKK